MTQFEIQAMKEKIDMYLKTLDDLNEYRGFCCSEQGHAERELEKFLHWLENN